MLEVFDKIFYITESIDKFIWINSKKVATKNNFYVEPIVICPQIANNQFMSQKQYEYYIAFYNLILRAKKNNYLNLLIFNDTSIKSHYLNKIDNLMEKVNDDVDVISFKYKNISLAEPTFKQAIFHHVSYVDEYKIIAIGDRFYDIFLEEGKNPTLDVSSFINSLSKKIGIYVPVSR